MVGSEETQIPHPVTVPKLDLESIDMPKNPHSVSEDPVQHIAWAQGAGAVYGAVESAIRAATAPAPEAQVGRYRVLTSADVIEAGDEFLQGDCTWQKDGDLIWVGARWTPLLRTARRAIQSVNAQDAAA